MLSQVTSCARGEAATICLRPCKLTFDLLTLKIVSESRVTWPTSVPILVFLGLSVLDLGPMYATDRRCQTSDVHHRLMPLPSGGEAIISNPRHLACIWDLACIRGPASIGTIRSDPRLVIEAQLIFGAGLLFEDLRYITQWHRCGRTALLCACAFVR